MSVFIYNVACYTWNFATNFSTNNPNKINKRVEEKKIEINAKLNYRPPPMWTTVNFQLSTVGKNNYLTISKPHCLHHLYPVLGYPKANVHIRQHLFSSRTSSKSSIVCHHCPIVTCHRVKPVNTNKTCLLSSNKNTNHKRKK